MLKAVRADDAYANLVLPAVLRERRLGGARRGVRHRARLGHAARPGHVRRRAGRLRRTVRSSKVEAKVLDALRLGTHQLLSMRVPAHAAITTSVDLVRARGRPPAGGLRQRACCARSPSRTWTRGSAEVAPGPGDRPDGHLAVAHSHPRWVVDVLREAVGDAELDGAARPPTTSRPRVTLVARPGRSEPRRAAGRADPLVALRRRARRRRPRRACAAVAEGRAGVQDEGSQLVALAAGVGRGRRAATSAGSTCAPDPAARPRCWRRSLPAREPRLVANERQPHRAGLVPRALDRRRRCARHRGGRRHPPAVGRRVLRPGAGRRAVHRPGRAAPPAGGALAAYARRPRRARAAPAGPARRRRSTWSGRAGSCSTPPARRCSPRRPASVEPRWRRGPTSALEDARALLRRGARLPPARCPAPCSCGRTGTAPTRCSWRCCGVPPSARACAPPGSPRARRAEPGVRGLSTQNTLPSGSAITTQPSSPVWPTSARVAPRLSRRATSAAWPGSASGRRSRCSRFLPARSSGTRRKSRSGTTPSSERVLRRLEGHLVGGVVRTPPAERLLPEGRQPVGVGRVDVEALDAQAHASPSPPRLPPHAVDLLCTEGCSGLALGGLPIELGATATRTTRCVELAST